MRANPSLVLLIVGALLAMLGPLAFADTFELISPVESDTLQFRDELIGIQFAFSREDGQYKRIAFSLGNLSDEAVAVDWNASSVTLPSGEASNVIHEGVRFMNSNTYIAPTTIPPRSWVTDSVIPTSSVKYSSSDWRVLSMGIDEGDEFGIYLSLTVDGDSRGYAFRFKAVHIRNLFPVARFDVDGGRRMGTSGVFPDHNADEKIRIAVPFHSSGKGRVWEVSFAASDSADQDGMIAKYAWTFGDGSTGSGVRVSHAYGSPGSYEVRLVVTDDKGATASVARTIAVIDSVAQSWKGTLGWLLLGALALGLAWLLRLTEM